MPNGSWECRRDSAKLRFTRAPRKQRTKDEAGSPGQVGLAREQDCAAKPLEPELSNASLVEFLIDILYGDSAKLAVCGVDEFAPFPAHGTRQRSVRAFLTNGDSARTAETIAAVS
jgi:hypothetical protein